MAKKTVKSGRSPAGKTARAEKGPIRGDMSIVEIVTKYPETAEVFIRHGLHCIGCAAARFETIDEGALAHGIELDPLLDDLNKVALKTKK